MVYANFIEHHKDHIDASCHAKFQIHRPSGFREEFKRVSLFIAMGTILVIVYDKHCIRQRR